MSRWQRTWYYAISVVGGLVAVLCLWATIEPGGFNPLVPGVFAAANAGFAVWNWRQARA